MRVQVKGRGLAFHWSIQDSMSACNAVTLLWTPRRSCRSVSRPNQRSTWLSHDELVGVKCRWNRGCAASQAPIGGRLVGGEVVADQMHFQARRGLARSICSRNFLNSAVRCRRCREWMTNRRWPRRGRRTDRWCRARA